MWKCTVCKKENQDSVLRCQCGFDRRLDYENLRTFVKLDTQDFQNYHKMKTTAQEAIKPKVEVKKPVENKPKVEASKPVENKPKVEASMPVANKPSGTTTTPPPAPPKTSPATPPKPVTPPSAKASTTTPPPAPPKTSPTTPPKSVTSAPAKMSTPSPDTTKPVAAPVLVEKTIFPKTKLDWLVLVIGAVLLCVAIWPDNVESAYFFTSEYFFKPLFDFRQNQSWSTIIFLTTISYLLMYKSLGAIQYKKRRMWIFIYPIFSLIPLCIFGDAVWGMVMSLMGDSEELLEIMTIDNLTASWYLLQIIIVLLAFFEDPAKIIAKRKARKEKRKARKMSILPQSFLQALVLVMGVALAVIFANRENLYYSFINIEDIHIWECVFIYWILLYWLGKRLRYTYKFFKVISYTFFSCFPLYVISDVIWSSDLLSSYAGEGGSVCVLFYIATWILVITMSVKEKQIKL